MKPDLLYGWMRLARATDKNEDIVFPSMDMETQLIVNILVYDIISMPYEFCTAVIGKGLMTSK